MSKKHAIYGLLAEFDTPDQILEAAKRTTAAGYRDVDAYTPIPIEELTDALMIRKTRLPLFVLIMGILGCLGGFFLQYFASVIDYPLNIGGRPLNSWPQFIPISFETTILFAATAGVLGMLFRNGFPAPYNPLFNVDRFDLASSDKFFLCVESTDAKFDQKETTRFLESLKPANVFVVDH